jgi:hypothetical protein
MIPANNGIILFSTVISFLALYFVNLKPDPSITYVRAQLNEESREALSMKQ